MSTNEAEKKRKMGNLLIWNQEISTAYKEMKITKFTMV